MGRDTTAEGIGMIVTVGGILMVLGGLVLFVTTAGTFLVALGYSMSDDPSEHMVWRGSIILWLIGLGLLALGAYSGL